MVRVNIVRCREPELVSNGSAGKCCVFAGKENP